jgi:hypothetical protein
MLFSASCGGDGVLDPGTVPPAGTGGTLQSLQASIFTPQCALPGCHVAPGAEQGMELSSGKTYVYTVGVDSVELSGFKRVAPGLSRDSYLYMKIAGDPRIIGDRMPLGGTLDASQIDAVRAWIDAGAQDN